MAVVTLKGHVGRALDFFHRNDIYFAVGRSTAWPTEDNPPTPTYDEDLQEVMGYKKAETLFIVRPEKENESGELSYRDSKWKIIDPTKALEEGARWVYISTFISYSELPTNLVYRQIGMYTGLQRKDGVSLSKFALLPEEVEDPGILEIIDNRRPIYREPDMREQLVQILEF